MILEICCVFHFCHVQVIFNRSLKDLSGWRNSTRKGRSQARKQVGWGPSRSSQLQPCPTPLTPQSRPSTQAGTCHLFPRGGMHGKGRYRHIMLALSTVAFREGPWTSVQWIRSLQNRNPNICGWVYLLLYIVYSSHSRETSFTTLMPQEVK